MSTKAAVCLVGSPKHAEAVVSHLHRVGVPYEDISVVYPDTTATHGVAHEQGTKAAEGAASGVGAGGIVGGTLGLLAGIGTLAIPGIGPLIAAGPILGALSGAAVGATVGGATGALIGLGVPEYEAKIYSGRLSDGRTLIAVHGEDEDELERAKDVFHFEKAESIHVTHEKDA